MEIQQNQSLLKYNTFAVDVKADFLAEVTSVAELQELLKMTEYKNTPKLILGGGSNSLFVNDFKGLVIVVKIMGRKIVSETDENAIVESGGGEDWHQFVLYTLQNNWGGLENLSYIPGSVGAAPVQNIGAYGVEQDQIFEQLTAVEVETGEIKTFTPTDCEFAYRESILKYKLKGKYVVTNVQYKLSKKPLLNTTYGNVREELEKLGKPETEWTIHDISNVVTEIRKTKLPDPKEIGTAGSFFKNPIIPMQLFEKLKADYPEIPSYPVDDQTIKLPAGWLIDQLGWKGWTSEDGKYGIHKQHALVLVNYGGGKGADILELAKKIQADVKQKFEIELEPEVVIVA